MAAGKVLAAVLRVDTAQKIGSKAVCKFHIYGAPGLLVRSITPSQARSSDAAKANLYVL